MKKLIFSRCGRHAIVDAIDYEWLSKHTWHVRTGGYFCTNLPTGTRRPNGKIKYLAGLMHRMIMKPKDGEEVDHINGSVNDNRRLNLRTCTHSQNGKNTSMKKNNTSGFKGVSWRPRDRLWRATICVNGKQKDVGMSKSKEVCARYYDAAAKKYYGEFARLNFPEEK